MKEFDKSVITAINEANKLCSSTYEKSVRLGSVKALLNAHKAFKELFPHSDADINDILWIDTFVYNMPTGIIDYIKYIYGRKELYLTGKPAK